MDRYVYVKSDESNNYFSDNQPFKFRIHLKTQLQFKGFWKVGLAEFHANIQNNTGLSLSHRSTALYLFTNICKESIVNGEQLPLLRLLQKNTDNGWSYSFNNIFYLPVKRKEVLEFEVFIKCEDGSFASFLDSPLYMTFHFKQYPFYTDYEPL